MFELISSVMTPQEFNKWVDKYHAETLLQIKERAKSIIEALKIA